MATNNLITLGNAATQFRIDDGHGEVTSATLALKYSIPFSGSGTHAYGILGLGAYHRSVDLTQTALGGGYVCDPWWGYCYPAVVEGDVIVASHSNTKFGWNVGGGFEFPAGDYGSWFIEARFQLRCGRESHGFIPVQVGLRFGATDTHVGPDGGHAASCRWDCRVTPRFLEPVAKIHEAVRPFTEAGLHDQFVVPRH